MRLEFDRDMHRTQCVFAAEMPDNLARLRYEEFKLQIKLSVVYLAANECHHAGGNFLDYETWR